MQTKVANFPYGTKNPYQDMMYSACSPEFTLSAPREVSFAQFANPDFRAAHGIIHLHWDDRLFRIVESDDTSPLFQEVKRGLERYRENGGRLIWTIHNQAAHSQTELTDNFRQIRQQLTQMSDLIHVHTPHAARHMISEYGADSEKIRLIPHPSYLGVYEPTEVTLNRSAPANQPIRFLAFGAMRGNRDLDKLHEAARKLTNRGHSFELSVVGKVFRSGRRLMRRMQVNPNVTVISDRVPDDEIPTIFSQSHVYTLPSMNTFTSGTAMLAQTFGLPIIGPDIDPHKHTTPEACHDLLYPAQNPRGLIRTMMRVMEMSKDELNEKRQACLQFAVARQPAHISGQLKQALAELT
ncbi:MULTISPECIES: glycosyltransferase family 4 protein [unclassified Ruegeria]|uniref:glycosyltransferase family 4 protein n=1 Tax=unclassified Ruegeria TaxID=2625375 RepID=UPI001ADBC247|nr:MULTISPECIES: glycosyltransferase family 4 protein [unclassified Ruegeria]MBO9411538.1 glycosyltransferase family 4 protein [Ruegeria sp. R8_1]MBO9415900.1 glycosyltransferase family 4 protein [Ruegeria sp. R8_2]